MAELVIKRIDATHSDSTKNIRGCYKAGDIINILDDGMADTMPHLTVLKILGLKKDDVYFLQKEHKKFIENTVKMTKKKYDYFQSLIAQNNKIDEKDTALTYRSDGITLDKKPEYIKTVSVGVSDETTLYEVRLSEYSCYQRRRYRIPKSLMDEWFGGGKTQKEITLLEWESIKTQIVDKDNGS